MSMLIEELQQLASNPWAWGVVAVLAVLAGQAVVQFLACPYASGKAKIGDAEMAEARRGSFVPSARFAMTMVGGALLTMTGLFMIAQGISPAIALGALVAGVMIIQTEPSRLDIREQTYAVIAHRDAPHDVLEGHRGRLRSSQRQLALTNVLIVAAVTAAMFVF
ncbi:MAG: hypothetical protein AAGK00_06205 [Pseudomonadota bacterium]